MTRLGHFLLAGAIALAVSACIHGCRSVPRVAAQGSIAGYALSGPVDSDVARDYLQGRRLPSDLGHTREQLLSERRVPSRSELESISRQYSPDVATLLFMETVTAQPPNRALRRRFEAELSHVRRVGVARAKPTVPKDLLVLLVPGWFYETNGHETNADYHVQRRLYERWSIPHRLVPIDENGAVPDNARVVSDAIREASARHRVFLVSASKSGAEVALALGRELPTRDLRRVVGWLSIGGVVRGSPLADRMLEPDLCWLARLKLSIDGFDLRGLESMQTEVSRRAFDGLHFPRHLRIFSYVPTPLSGHVSDRGAFGYQRMRELGPNDGLTLLSDELLPSTRTILAPGVDHFLGPREEQGVWSTAILRTILAELHQPAP